MQVRRSKSLTADQSKRGPTLAFHLIYRAAETTAVVMFLVAAAGVSAWLITTAYIRSVEPQPFLAS